MTLYGTYAIQFNIALDLLDTCLKKKNNSGTLMQLNEYNGIKSINIRHGIKYMLVIANKNEREIE